MSGSQMNNFLLLGQYFPLYFFLQKTISERSKYVKLDGYNWLSKVYKYVICVAQKKIRFYTKMAEKYCHRL